MIRPLTAGLYLKVERHASTEPMKHSNSKGVEYFSHSRASLVPGLQIFTTHNLGVHRTRGVELGFGPRPLAIAVMRDEATQA